MANRYYTSFPLALGEIILQGPEARHLAMVMRARPGDVVCLFNGDGAEYPATILAIGKRDVTLRIDSIERPNRELFCELEIAAAVPKGDREEFLIEKLTELGVTRFMPLVTDRSVVVPKAERLRRTVIEASKQCGRNVLMEVADVMPFNDYILQSKSTACRWLAHPVSESGSLSPGGGGLGRGGDTIEHARRYPPPRPSPTMREGEKPEPSSITIAIGPEGGFTENEVQSAISKGWQCITLGPRILRIETAAIGLAAYYAFSARSA
jgi:16S rRNA (uracil1498-N3)-methyltransferase